MATFPQWNIRLNVAGAEQIIVVILFTTGNNGERLWRRKLLSESHKIIFVGPEAELGHPMMRKMTQRAGLAMEDINYIPLGQRVPQSGTIVSLGEQALNSLVGERDLFRWRGRLVNKGSRIILPTLQPTMMLARRDMGADASQLYRKPSRFQGMWVWDVQKAIKNAGKPVVQPNRQYIVDPSPYIWNQLVEEALSSNLPLSYDIEVAMHKEWDEEDQENQFDVGAITRISFAWKDNHAVSVYFAQPYLAGIRRLLESTQVKIGWNAFYFDNPILAKNGYIVNGPIWDGFDLWHLLKPEQPRGVEYVSSVYTPIMPWKHLSGSNPGWYSCADSDIARLNVMGIKRDLEENNMWQLAQEHVIELMPMLKRAGERGNFIDIPFRDAFKLELENERIRLNDLAQPLYPHVLKPRKRFKTEPKDTDGRVFEQVEVVKEQPVCTNCGQVASNKTEHMKGGKKNNPCKAAGATTEPKLMPAIEWDEVLEFNPNSADQIKDYIRWFKHPMGYDRKTEQDSVNLAHLEDLNTKFGEQHPIYDLVAQFKRVSKTISTYIYEPDENGLIHTTYGNWTTTWRLASRNINLQNVGKREQNKWAKKARRQIVARPGHVFVQADSTSIEAVALGWLIRDWEFTAVANKSIHAWLVADILGIPFTDENLELIKKKHKDLYNQIKTAIYLIINGGDPYLIWKSNPKTFKSHEEAKHVERMIFNKLPKLETYHQLTRDRAKKEGKLQTPWGYVNYFYDVYTFKRDKAGEIEYDKYGAPKIKRGADGNTSVNFEIQNIAQAVMRDSSLIIGRSEWAQYMCAAFTVHDGYLLEVPEELKEEAGRFLVSVLTRRIPQLDNMIIGCELEYGYNWADASEDNPLGMKSVLKIEGQLPEGI